jgi:pimeloyl-ACP methyl ester carboxylesterase
VKVIEDEEVETPYWTRTKISYNGAAGQRTDGLVPENKRVLAYLWLPKNAPRPLQVINYKPGGASYAGLTAPQETEVVCGPFILAGRAVFVVVIEGMRERDLPPDWKFPDEGTVAYRDAIVQDTIDQRRGLDYLATRNDVDMNKIVCMGLSAGGYDLVTMAVEKRFQGFFLLAAGLGLGGKKEQKMAAEANPVNFAPYISGPKLMIQGRYDESIPLKTSAEPLFALLTEPKKLIVLETGHFPPLDQWVPPAQKWMDETLGPVGAP